MASSMAISSLLIVVLPSTLCLWILSLLLHNIFGTMQITPVRWFITFTIPILFAYGGYKRNSLCFSGAVAAFFVGFVIALSNYGFMLCLIFFFVSSSKATNFKKDVKLQLEDDFKVGGQRNWAQVLSNGIVATVIALLYLIDCGCSEQLLDFQKNYRCSWLSAAFLGSVCCCNGDTWASEFGSVLSKANPRLITTLKVVPRGTNGGVSIAGLVASFLGGAFISSCFLVSLFMLASSAAFQNSPSQLSLVLIGGIAGFLGSLIDSFLGATLQFSGINENGKVVEVPGAHVKHINGYNILGNHGVNLISNFLMALLTPSITACFI